VSANQPSAVQVEELRRYAAEHGRTWKAQLLSDWEAGRTVGPLQELRNQFGPSWLAAHGSAAIKSSRDLAVDTGSALARQVFQKRGNNSEVHLSEPELAAAIALGIERAAEAEATNAAAESAAEYLKALERHRSGGQHALHVLSFGDAKARRLRAEAERAEEIVRRMAKLVDDDTEGCVDETPAFRELEKQLRACGEEPGKLTL
jgi:hypothetical protein